MKIIFQTDWKTFIAEKIDPEVTISPHKQTTLKRKTTGQFLCPKHTACHSFCKSCCSCETEGTGLKCCISLARLCILSNETHTGTFVHITSPISIFCAAHFRSPETTSSLQTPKSASITNFLLELSYANRVLALNSKDQSFACWMLDNSRSQTAVSQPPRGLRVQLRGLSASCRFAVFSSSARVHLVSC